VGGSDAGEGVTDEAEIKFQNRIHPYRFAKQCFSIGNGGSHVQ